MMEYRAIERRLVEGLHISRRPVAVTFAVAAPAGTPRSLGTVPSGCSFWRIAATGRTFSTVPSDHYNCVIGSHTHNISLPEERAGELPQMLTLMTGIGYIRMEEVPNIPRLPRMPGG